MSAKTCRPQEADSRLWSFGWHTRRTGSSLSVAERFLPPESIEQTGKQNVTSIRPVPESAQNLDGPGRKLQAVARQYKL